MSVRRACAAGVTAVAALLAAAPVPAVELGGYLAAELRVFAHPPLDPRQHGDAASVAAEPELFESWDGGRQQFVARPFLRIDSGDPQRTHFDLRELSWSIAERSWELRAGVRRVFWGVTESQHLVDVINQTDLVEDIDGEDKLGQPMVNLALVRDWGTLDLFVMPWFRERTYPGTTGRLRKRHAVATSAARYRVRSGRHHLDLAVRWSRSVGPFDIGIAHFRGIGREPTLVAGLDRHGRAALVPVYDRISQTSLDLQATIGAWLLKLEALQRSGQGRTFAAAVGGFEYTFYRVLGAADLGLLGEYSFDDRGAAATSGFQNDLFVGARLALNDAASSEALAGVITDLSGGASVLSLEASRRLGDRWKLSLEARAITAPRALEPLNGLERDDYLQIEIARYF